MAIKIEIHGHIGEARTFEALVAAIASYESWTVSSNGLVSKVKDDRLSVSKARNILIERNMQDEGLTLSYEYDPDGAEKALMEFGRLHEVDITIRRTWGVNADGYVTFVRNGGDPIKLPLAGGKVAVTADTMQVLTERGMCTIETVSRLLSVLDEARNLPRFTIADDVVRAAVLPKRSIG